MASDRIPKFWPLLEYFWETDRINNWRRTIFPDPQNPHTGIKSCFNLISLCPNAHSFWSRGLFALKPLELSGDRKRLDIQFFWQPHVKSKADERLDLLTEPSSSRGLNSADECALPSFYMNQPVNIRSGDTFTLTTDDPESRPLPSLELLDMQWVLQRLVAMCGVNGRGLKPMMTRTILATTITRAKNILIFVSGFLTKFRWYQQMHKKGSGIRFLADLV